MYQKIMVPLDGSELAECVLPHMKSIAEGCAVKNVTLVRVVVPAQFPSGALSDGGSVLSEIDTEDIRKRTDEVMYTDAEDYINRKVSELKAQGLKVDGKVITGKAAETLTEYAEKNSFDLIIIATHGRSGPSRWMWGSTADKLLRSACVPVLMVRAPGCVPGF